MDEMPTPEAIRLLIIEENGIPDDVLSADTLLCGPEIGFDELDLAGVLIEIESTYGVTPDTLDEYLDLSEAGMETLTPTVLSAAVEKALKQ